MAALRLINPFMPGAGHRPPYLAGREGEKYEFRRLASQDVILENMILTGLRGVGKTVLLDEFKPIAQELGWIWIGADLSESASVSEERLVRRLLADLAVAASSIVVATEAVRAVGFEAPVTQHETTLNYDVLLVLYERTPGLVSDKLKAILEFVWEHLRGTGHRGLVFVYDEAQNLADHAEKEEYPLSVLLDVFQSIQRKKIPFLLVLTGLPTLFPKLVEARTFAERMFRVVFLRQLSQPASRDAIRKPIETEASALKLSDEVIEKIIALSAGYPYFIQFICREVFDSALVNLQAGRPPSIPVEEIIRKLDTDFFAGRWSRATDRQRDLLAVVAHLDNAADEFTTQEIVALAKKMLEKPFSSSHVTQMLVALGNAGLIYKNRHGRYSFAVPLLDQFIRRQAQNGG